MKGISSIVIVIILAIGIPLILLYVNSDKTGFAYKPSNIPPDKPPTVSVTHSPSKPTTKNNVTFTAEASDDIGLKKIVIFVDKSSIGSCSVSGKSAKCIKSAGPFSKGTHTYYANATDTKLQSSKSLLKSFNVVSP